MQSFKTNRLIMIGIVGAIALTACDNTGTTADSTDQSTMDSMSADRDSMETAESARMEGDAGAMGGAEQAAAHEFFTKAAIGGMYEVEAAQLASTRATDPAIKQFATQMISDHESKNAELMTLAQKEKVTVPSAMDEKHREMLKDLSEKSGEEFDDAYMSQQIDAHQQMISLFEDAAEGSKDVDVKAFAQQTLPALQQHLKMAKDIEQEVEKRTQKEVQGKRYIVDAGSEPAQA